MGSHQTILTHLFGPLIYSEGEEVINSEKKKAESRDKQQQGARLFQRERNNLRPTHRFFGQHATWQLQEPTKSQQDEFE
jgi:hypothetical protein